VINFHEVKFMKILLLPLVMGGIGKGRCLIGRPPASSGKQAFWLFSFFSRVFVPRLEKIETEPTSDLLHGISTTPC